MFLFNEVHLSTDSTVPLTKSRGFCAKFVIRGGVIVVRNNPSFFVTLDLEPRGRASRTNRPRCKQFGNASILGGIVIFCIHPHGDGHCRGFRSFPNTLQCFPDCTPGVLAQSHLRIFSPIISLCFIWANLTALECASDVFGSCWLLILSKCM